MKKIKQLQGLRALAILGIFVSHTCIFLGVSPETFALLNKLGPFGVFTFFMLSGYFLGIQEDTLERLSIKKSIYKAWNKIKKLYPLFFLTLILAFFAKYPSTPKEWALDAVSFPFHLTLTQSAIPHIGIVMAYNGPAWFLSSFMLIWILVYHYPTPINAIKRSSAKKTSIYISTILLCQLAYQLTVSFLPIELVYGKRTTLEGWLTSYNPLLCYSIFLLGICISRIKLNSPIRANLYQAIALLCILPFVLESWTVTNASMVVAEIMLLLTICSLQIPNSLASRLLSMNPWVWLGNISGYFFLIHGPVNYAFRSLWGVEGKPYLFFVSLGVSLIASYMYQLYTDNSKS